MFGRLRCGGPRLRGVRHDAGGAGQDGGPELPGLVHAEVCEPHRGLAGVGDLELELGEPEDPGEQRLHDVDRLDPVQPGLPLLFEEESGVDPDIAFRHLVAGEVPAQDVAQPGEQQQHTAAEQQPRCPAGELLIDKGAALEHPFEGVPEEEERNRGQRHPAAHER